MENIIIRLAQFKDAPQIAKVHIETWQCAYRGQLPDSYLDNLSLEKRVKRWKRILNNPRSKNRTFVAELSSKIVGFASVGPCRDKDMPTKTGELLAIYVDSDNMAKGIGSTLLKASLDYLKKFNFNKATLWVLTSNEKTRKWYESRSWKVEGKTKTGSRDNIKLRETRYIIDLK